MGFLRSIAESIRQADNEREYMDDDRTTDRYLRSLRRHDRKQNEEIEKIMLEKKIKEYEQKRGEILTRLNNQGNEKKRVEIIKRKTMLYKSRMFDRGNLL